LVACLCSFLFSFFYFFSIPHLASPNQPKIGLIWLAGCGALNLVKKYFFLFSFYFVVLLYWSWLGLKLLVVGFVVKFIIIKKLFEGEM